MWLVQLLTSLPGRRHLRANHSLMLWSLWKGSNIKRLAMHVQKWWCDVRVCLYCGLWVPMVYLERVLVACTHTCIAVMEPLPSVRCLFPNSLAPQMVTVWNSELVIMACCEWRSIPVTKASHVDMKWAQGHQSMGQGTNNRDRDTKTKKGYQYGASP